MIASMELNNLELREWLDEVERLCEPNQIHICDGSDEEYELLTQRLCDKGVLTRLNNNLRPNSFLACSAPEDVARVESKTFICSKTQEAAGPTNNWRDPSEMMEEMRALFKGCMKGRTCYVIPYCMGPIDSPLAKFGLQVTDSAYVVVNMRWMTRMGKEVWNRLNQEKEAPFFVRCWHSVGVPLNEGEKDVKWPCNPEKLHVVHFPHLKQIWSFGSGYGGNALLGKKCLALRIASEMAREEGWLAEHMLIMGVTNPEGQKKYIAAAFPSACGKTNLAMMEPTLPGWKVECVGDDIAWMYFDDEGQLRAINPEAGFFGVAPGTSIKTNPVATRAIERHSLFTNVALLESGDVWWEGLDLPEEEVTDWRGNPWQPESGVAAAHPNSRFTVSIEQCSSLDPNWQDPKGVPISAIVFGGRRSGVTPLVMEAFDWNHGTLYGASLSSEKTAAATGNLGELRHDPFAMLPFCGYHMGDYFKHWVELGKERKKLPKIFYVNWFRKNSEGEFIWPGFGENSRVIEWIFDRTEGKRAVKETAVGYLPDAGSLNLEGLKLSDETTQALLNIDSEEWRKEVTLLREYFKLFGEHFPKELLDRLSQVEDSLG